MTPEDEGRFLGSFEAEAGRARVLTAGDIKAAWEARLGHSVNKTTVYRMLERHGWRKVAPRPRHPKKDEGAGEAFKKGASRKGSPKPAEGRRRKGGR
jgi:transposase